MVLGISLADYSNHRRADIVLLCHKCIQMDTEEHSPPHDEWDRENYSHEGVSGSPRSEFSYERGPLHGERDEEKYSNEGVLGGGRLESSYEKDPRREERDGNSQSNERGSESTRSRPSYKPSPPHKSVKIRYEDIKSRTAAPVDLHSYH